MRRWKRKKVHAQKLNKQQETKGTDKRDYAGSSPLPTSVRGWIFVGDYIIGTHTAVSAVHRQH
jgi:hypothetical protein